RAAVPDGAALPSMGRDARRGGADLSGGHPRRAARYRGPVALDRRADDGRDRRALRPRVHPSLRERRRAEARRLPERAPGDRRQRRGREPQLGRGARRRGQARLRADRVLQLPRGLRRLRLRLLEPGRPRLTVLQTTIAGSLPKPAWLAEPKKLWAPWLLEGELLDEGKRDAMRLVLGDQESAGIDI